MASKSRTRGTEQEVVFVTDLRSIISDQRHELVARRAMEVNFQPVRSNLNPLFGVIDSAEAQGNLFIHLEGK